MKKSLKTILIGCLLTCVFFTGCETTEKLFDLKDYSEVEIKENEEFLSTLITYPEFHDYDDLNKLIKNTIETDWKNFKEHSENSWYDVKALNPSAFCLPFEYIVDYSVSYSKDIVSVYLSTYSFNGGAHGNTTIRTINYDKKNKQYLNIVEATGYTYEELSQICDKDLYDQFIGNDEAKFNLDQGEIDNLDEMRRGGVAPYASNFENFVLDGNKLIIYFEQYSVAPYSYGICQVEVPLK